MFRTKITIFNAMNFEVFLSFIKGNESYKLRQQTINHFRKAFLNRENTIN